jgi:hypothetical protein
VLALADELEPAFLGEGGEDEAELLAVAVGSEAELAVVDGFFDGLHVAGAEGFDEELRGFGNGDGGDGPEVSGRAVVVDLDVFDDGRRGAAGANGSQLVMEMVNGLVHVHFRVEKDVVEWHGGYGSRKNGEWIMDNGG